MNIFHLGINDIVKGLTKKMIIKLKLRKMYRKNHK